ncbi:MAG: hypothetical protein L0Z73_12735 [Gammaproteobacteria bacterium]|nr:hypothetical protein [Gammaproteobacteria bacterium]
MIQSRIFGGFIIVVVLALVGYIGVLKIDWDNNSGSTDSAREILTYVPADTLFFFGGLEPAPFQHAIDMIAPESGWLKHADWSQSLTDKDKADMPPAVLMITSLFGEYMQIMQSPATAAGKLGIGDKIDSAAYTVGFIPVMRVKLADANAFTALIDQAEKNAGLSSSKQTVGDITMRSYSFDKPGAAKSSEVNLLIGTNNQYAVISLSSKIEGDKAHNVIVGSDKPAQSLANLTVLQDIKNKYNFHPAYVSYVNHREIMNGLTGESSNEFGRMLDAVIAMAEEARAKAAAAQEPKAGPSDDPAMAEENEGGQANTPATQAANSGKPLDAIRTEACRKELMVMVDSWPQTVFGYTKLDLESKPKVMEMRMLVESTDTAFMQEMQKIRGFIPTTLLDVTQNPIIGFGLGINMDQLSPFIAKAMQGFTSKDYQCEFLAQAKMGLLQSNPAMALGMMTGMVAGLQGISATVLDVDGNIDFGQQGAPPDIKSIDAMVTITSANPQQLLMMAANFQPGMPPLQLPPDGAPIDFPMPIPLPNGESIKLALKGNHIVAYVGERSAKLAEKLAAETLQPNGMFAFNMDFGKYMKMVANIAQNAPQTEGNKPAAMTDQEKEMIKAMSSMKMQFVESFDIDPNGIAFDVKMTME